MKKTSIAAVFAAAIAASSSGMAQPMADAGWYVGGSIGQSDMDDSIAAGLIDPGSGPVDGKDTAFKVFGGYLFNRNFGVEFAYMDLGAASYSGTFSGFTVTGGKVEVSGFNLSAVGMLPVGPALSVFGKLGFFSWDAEASDVTGGVPFSATADGSDLSFGAGMSYSFTRNLAARAEWERLQVEDADVDVLSIGLVYRF